MLGQDLQVRLADDEHSGQWPRPGETRPSRIGMSRAVYDITYYPGRQMPGSKSKDSKVVPEQAHHDADNERRGWSSIYMYMYIPPTASSSGSPRTTGQEASQYPQVLCEPCLLTPQPCSSQQLQPRRAQFLPGTTPTTAITGHRTRTRHTPGSPRRTLSRSRAARASK